MLVKFLRTRSILLSASLLILAALFIVGYFGADVRDVETQEELPFCLVYKQDGINKRIQGFIEEERIYYCIPGNVLLNNIHLDMDTAKRLWIGDKAFKSGDVLGEVEMNREYKAMNAGTDDNDAVTVIFMQGSKVPVIRLSTASGSMEYIHAEKGNHEGGFMEVSDADGRLDTAAKIKSIYGRGNTAWDAEKKSYTVKLDNAENILGMGKEKIWVLNANYYDGAYIRNQIGFEIARSGGILYVPDERFVDLYMNDEYMGLYQIMEKIKTGKNRMDIGNDYLLEIDYIERVVSEDSIFLPNEQPIEIHEPEKNRNIEGVQRFFDNFTSYMETGDIASAMEKIDMESFAKMFVMEEILQDMDFGFTSHYMYLDLEDEILYDGPVWDLDNTMGRGTAVEATAFFVTNYELQYNNLGRWYARLYGQPEFSDRVAQEYRESFRPAIVSLLEGGIEEREAAIAASVFMDKKRYTNPRSVFMPEASIEEHIAHLTGYLQDKLRIMDACFSSEQAAMAAEITLPELKVQESFFEPEDKEVENRVEEEEQGVLSFIMNYRFWLLLLVMFGSCVILWYQCRKLGK